MTVEHVDSGEILSQSVISGDVVYVCGLTATDRTLDIAGQTAEVLAKIDDRLAKCGSDKSKILMATIYLTSIDLKSEMNEVWKSWLGDLKRPARACVGGIELTPGVLVEIVVSAAR
tara:strand:+ start:66 stop:413 length:348 start_codon:yes stop_codon:yes gene_type:complete